MSLAQRIMTACFIVQRDDIAHQDQEEQSSSNNPQMNLRLFKLQAPDLLNIKQTNFQT